VIVTGSSDCTSRVFLNNGTSLGILGADKWRVNDRKTFRRLRIPELQAQEETENRQRMVQFLRSRAEEQMASIERRSSLYPSSSPTSGSPRSPGLGGTSGLERPLSPTALGVGSPSAGGSGAPGLGAAASGSPSFSPSVTVASPTGTHRGGSALNTGASPGGRRMSRSPGRRLSFAPGSGSPPRTQQSTSATPTLLGTSASSLATLPQSTHSSSSSPGSSPTPPTHRASIVALSAGSSPVPPGQPEKPQGPTFDATALSLGGVSSLAPQRVRSQSISPPPKPRTPRKERTPVRKSSTSFLELAHQSPGQLLLLGVFARRTLVLLLTLGLSFPRWLCSAAGLFPPVRGARSKRLGYDDGSDLPIRSPYPHPFSRMSESAPTSPDEEERRRKSLAEQAEVEELMKSTVITDAAMASVEQTARDALMAPKNVASPRHPHARSP
jgi:hypothetical protein